MDIKIDKDETQGFQVIAVMLAVLCTVAFLVRGCQTTHPETCEKINQGVLSK